MTTQPHRHPTVAALEDEPLTPEEWAHLEAIPVSEAELAETLDLIRWFKRRYPTVRARLAYARRKYREVTRKPAAIRPPDS